MTAPVHVLKPPRLELPPARRVALAPIVAKESLSRELEQAIIAGQPTEPATLTLLSSTQLMEASPIRLASTAPLTSDLTAIHAARTAQADLLLMGEVIQDELDDPELQDPSLPPELSRYSKKQTSFFAPANVQRPQRVAIAWRVFDVRSGQLVGGQTMAIDRFLADRKYPELQLTEPIPRQRVIAASAKDTWQAVSPYIEKQNVMIALPWLQPGASQIRRGNAYARAGKWDMAETEWTIAATRYPWSNSAKLNLAIAQAAREDFDAAKETLGTMGPLRMRRMQAETLVWIDTRHRWHHAALELPPPEKGWAFPDPIIESSKPLQPSTAPSPEEAPWWTAIPLTKPPGWTWRQWLLQPWAL